MALNQIQGWNSRFYLAVSEMGTLDFLELRYTVEWPVNIVITEKSIVKYNKVSHSVQKRFFLKDRLVRMRGV